MRVKTEDEDPAVPMSAPVQVSPGSTRVKMEEQHDSNTGAVYRSFHYQNQIKKEDPHEPILGTQQALNRLLDHTARIDGESMLEHAQLSPQVREQNKIQSQLDEFRQV